MSFTLEVSPEPGYYSDDDQQYDCNKFRDYRPDDNVFAFHYDSNTWLHGIIMGPSNSNGTTPVHFWQDFPNILFEVEPRDIMTLLDGFEYAYHKGIKRGQQIRHEELCNSYDCGFENGKKMQAAQIEGAYIAGRLQVQKEYNSTPVTPVNRISTVRAYSAIQKSVQEEIHKELSIITEVLHPADSTPAGDIFRMIIDTTETNSFDKIVPSNSWQAYDDLPEATPEETKRATELFKQNRDNFLRQQDIDIRNKKIEDGKKILQAFRNKRKTTLESGGTDPHCTSTHSSIAFKPTSSSSNIASINAFIKIEQATSTASALAYDALDFGITTSKNFTFVSPPPPTASFGSAGADVSLFSFNNPTTIFQPCSGGVHRHWTILHWDWMCRSEQQQVRIFCWTCQYFIVNCSGTRYSRCATHTHSDSLCKPTHTVTVASIYVVMI